MAGSRPLRRRPRSALRGHDPDGVTIEFDARLAPAGTWPRAALVAPDRAAAALPDVRIDGRAAGPASRRAGPRGAEAPAGVRRRPDTSDARTPRDRALRRLIQAASLSSVRHGGHASLYHRAGGTPFFEALVRRFYAGVAGDPILRPLYPEADLAPAQQRLTLFLIQYWGGPRRTTRNAATRGCGCATLPFAIGTVERDRWLVHMRAAIAGQLPPPDVAAELERYIAMAAEAMRNRD